jgi:hypothetical protein
MTNKGGRTRRPNRTSEEIQAAEAAEALKRQEKSDKAATKLAKNRVKAVRNMIKAKEKAELTSWLKWSVEGSLKLLRYVQVVKEAHDLLEQQRPGFVKFSMFMDSHDPRTEPFPLLAKINNEMRLRQYRVLVGIYQVSRSSHLLVWYLWLNLPFFAMLQQVKDYVDQSGSGGLLTDLVEFGLAQPVCVS